MKLSLAVYLLFSCLWLGISTTTLAKSMSKPGCQETCGNVTVPYPFGIGPNCSANSSFTLSCNHSTLFLNSIKTEVVNISLLGVITVKQPVSPMNCSNAPRTGSLPISLQGSPFTISARYNSLASLGCRNLVWLRTANGTSVGGCAALCEENSNDTSCNGFNCCQITIPPRLKELQYAYRSSGATNNGSCGPRNEYIPVVLEWEFGEMKGVTNHTCAYADDYCLTYPDDYGRREFKPDSNYSSYFTCRTMHGDYIYSYREDEFAFYYPYSGVYDYASSSKYCSCPPNFEGNPYLPGGCTYKMINCSNCADYDRIYNKKLPAVKIAFISIGSALGGLILLLVASVSTRVIRERIKANRRRRHFKRNGGLLLVQQLSATENGLQKTKLFSSKELAQATDHYNENRILGRGGQGTVYKGMLTDGRIIAVKKSQKVEEGDLDVFINEVVILSQVNHRNVVKLLGCCLETEVPHLVYEFIPNGTLYHHIHEPNEELPLTWEMRVRIAREVAGALAYLHSASSAPIYHRDIKSTNILLDDKYHAKIADFGTSKSVSIDQTHLTTRVVGTFGYMDPEYFRSSQFTEKSDVYSFGVVMVELLTGERAITSVKMETGRSLVAHFLHSMEEDKLFEIVDVRVAKEGKREEVVWIAEVARRCLHLNGKNRPKMKEVAVMLEGIQMQKEDPNFLQKLEDEKREFGWINEGADELYDFSSISGTMYSDTTTTPYSLESDRPLMLDHS